MELKSLETHHGRVPYLEGGSGPPLVFLHGAMGVEAGDPLLAALSARFHVFAPYLPGYAETEDRSDLRDMLDYTLHSWDVIDALGLKNPLLVGHSMGGMIAAEMAAIAPHDVSRLALIAPYGLWLDDHPIPDVFTFLPYKTPEFLFHDVEAGTARMTAGLKLDDPKFLQDYLVRNARQMGMAGKLLFPVPDRGLKDRLYRVRAKTVVVWGESDRLIDPTYGQAFVLGIEGATLVKVPQAGHMVNLEQPERAADAISGLA